MKVLTVPTLIFFLAFTAFESFAQKARSLGVNVILESATDSYKPGLGVNY